MLAMAVGAKRDFVIRRDVVIFICPQYPGRLFYLVISGFVDFGFEKRVFFIYFK